MTLRRYTSSSPPELYLSSVCVSRGTPRRGRANPLGETSNSRKPHQTPSKFHACTTAVCLQSSRARLPSSRTQYLHASTSTRVQRASRAPDLLRQRLQRASLPPFFHTYTPAAHLQSSRSPYLHICTPAAKL